LDIEKFNISNIGGPHLARHFDAFPERKIANQINHQKTCLNGFAIFVVISYNLNDHNLPVDGSQIVDAWLNMRDGLPFGMQSKKVFAEGDAKINLPDKLNWLNSIICICSKSKSTCHSIDKTD
jgi:hypothetical protein